ncbi:unnamed protein product, partial [Ixodes pacificus]
RYAICTALSSGAPKNIPSHQLALALAKARARKRSSEESFARTSTRAEKLLLKTRRPCPCPCRYSKPNFELKCSSAMLVAARNQRPAGRRAHTYMPKKSLKQY